MRDLSVDDLYENSRILAVNGQYRSRTAILTRSQPRANRDDYATTLWAVDVLGAEPPRLLTPDTFGAASACLSPDAQYVAFLSQRGGDTSPQIHLLPLAGGEARRLPAGELAIARILEWSADARHLLVTVTVPFAEDALDDPAHPARPVVARSVPYKMDGRGATCGRRTHLYRVALDGSEPVPLTEGDFDVSAGTWSPDGKRLAYTRSQGERERHRIGLWLADADGARARRAVSDEFAVVAGATWSPDSQRIAFCGSKQSGDSIGRLYCLDANGGEPRLIGGDDIHLEGSQLRWDPRGEWIAALGNHCGRFEIVLGHPGGGRCRWIHRGLRQISALAAADDGLVFVSTSLCWPDEACFVGWDGHHERRLTRFNRDWMRHRRRPRCSLRRFQVPDGRGGQEQVEAWLIRPPGNRPPPYPVLFDMHGGPQSVVLLDFAGHVYRYELAARGWLIVAPNTVGSSGYGEDFAKRLRGHWGELDLPQHLAIMDRLQRDGLIDGRTACVGKSYGGFLSAWAAGCGDRFRAAVVSAPVANVESHAGTSDTGYYVTPYSMGGEIDDCPDRYRALSPVEYFKQVNAPTLLLCGQDDARCPVGQVEELLARIVRQTETEGRMVLYPGGDHALAASGRPSHRRDYHRRIVEWVVRHADGPTGGAANEAQAG